MVSAGKVTLKFEVDIADLEAKIQRSKNAIAGLESAANKTTQNLAKTGQQSTTTAVQFQTLSQGAINLTTSFAQTYTSLSNLQRAQTTVAAATVSLERSQDLIQRKMYQLKRERDKEIKDYEKIQLLSREVATAKRDEAVKVQKLADAQDQANDVNILFGINLLNVGFSAIQTGKSMLDMAKAAKDTANGVAGVSKSVGLLSKALTFLQAHPVFAIMTVAILAWEFAISGIIKDITGVDYSLQSLTKQAFGIDKMKDSTEILGTEFENTGYEIESMGGKMTSVSGNMVTSIGSVGSAVKTLRGNFTNINNDLTKMITALSDPSAIQPSTLDGIKTINSEIRSITSDIEMLREKGHKFAEIEKLISEDILQDHRELLDVLGKQLDGNLLTKEAYDEQLALLYKQETVKQSLLKQTIEQVRQEERLSRAMENTQKKTKNLTPFDKLLLATVGTSKTFKKNDQLVRHLFTEGMGEIQAKTFLQTGFDIGGVAETVGEKEASRIALIEKGLSFFTNVQGGLAEGAKLFLNQQSKDWTKRVVSNAFAGSSGFGGGFFKSSGATAAFQVARGSIRVAWREEQIAIEDRNRRRLQTGGIRNPNLPLWDPNAVTGGFTSMSAFREDARQQFASSGMQAIEFVRALGGNPQMGFPNKAAVNRMYSQAITQATETRSLLARTGLSISMLPSFDSFGFKRGGGGFGNVSMAQAARMSASISNRYQAAVSATIAANQLTLKRAGQIDLLIGGFGLDSYYGSGLGLQELQLAVQKQDALIQSIGLNRTEAFRIIDTQGRGRNEIEDRLRWTQRQENISSGNIVL